MYEEAEAIIFKEKPDMIIFLGDYFDKFDCEPTITTKVARWLKGSICKSNRVHLLGNHELFYASGNEQLKCSGNTGLKFQTIAHENIDWSKFKLYHWMDDWLCTHAGFSNTFYNEFRLKGQSPEEFIEQDSKQAMDCLLKGEHHRLFAASFVRGGDSDKCGTLWCDIVEFEPIPRLKQIFGHSNVEEPKWIDKSNICMDANGYYLLNVDRKIKVKSLIVQFRNKNK
jgi:hypothetical protein